MGRFRDLWASGKFVLEGQKEQVKFQQQQAGGQMFDNVSPEFAVPDSTRAIFDALKSRRGSETGRWLREMGTEKPEQQKVVAAPTSAGSFEDTVAWIDMLFKEFGDLAYEFNKTAIGSELLITYERPNVYQTKSDDVWYRPVTKTYQGRLTTRQWALIVKGLEKKISIVLLPATMLLAYTAGQMNDDEQPPFMELLRSDDGSWNIGGEAIPQSSVPHLAKELLGDLIRLSSGVMSETELFSHAGEAPKLGENMAIGYQHPTPNAVPVVAPNVDSQSSSMHDACDLVDAIVDRELKRLYAEAGKVKPGEGSAANIRKQISAVETFRGKMMEAFTEYTHATQAGAQEAEKPAPTADLLR